MILKIIKKIILFDKEYNNNLEYIIFHHKTSIPLSFFDDNKIWNLSKDKNKFILYKNTDNEISRVTNRYLEINQGANSKYMLRNVL